MKKTISVLLASFMLAACSPIEIRDTGEGLEIDGMTFTNYTLWGCKKYSSDKRVALELVKTDKNVGAIILEAFLESVEAEGNEEVKKKLQDNKEAEEKLQNLGVYVGFILFDGSKDYETAMYERKGVNHRWQWGEFDNGYLFVIKPGGTGLFYDFTNVKNNKKGVRLNLKL